MFSMIAKHNSEGHVLQATQERHIHERVDKLAKRDVLRATQRHHVFHDCEEQLRR